MTTRAVTVMGLVLGGAAAGALAYWWSSGDLLLAGVVGIGCSLAGMSSLSRQRLPGSVATEGAPPPAEVRRPAKAGHRTGPGVSASPSATRLAALLRTRKGYKPVGPAVDGDAAAEATFGFLGRRRHWGSHAWIALVGADNLTLAEIDAFASRFFDLVWNDVSLLGMPAYGVLCFVFDATPTPALVDRIRSLKRAPNAAKGNWLVYWTIDLATGRVISHAGAPWGLFPGRAYLEKAIAS